jgi:hypothetical protein
MTIAIGVQKTVSDRANVVTAIVLLGSDQVIPNPLTTLSTPDIIQRVYSQLGITSDKYDIGQVSLSSVTSPYFSQISYQFAMRFVLKGTIVTDPQFIGPPGIPGNSGSPGQPGAPGKQGQAGFTGPQGATGPSGGVPGATGPTGPAGVQGPAGVTGWTGPPGATGPAGVQGPAGVTGWTGPPGVTGWTGPPGATGPSGIYSPPYTTVDSNYLSVVSETSALVSLIGLKTFVNVSSVSQFHTNESVLISDGENISLANILQILPGGEDSPEEVQEFVFEDHPSHDGPSIGKNDIPWTVIGSDPTVPEIMPLFVIETANILTAVQLYIDVKYRYNVEYFQSIPDGAKAGVRIIIDGYDEPVCQISRTLYNQLNEFNVFSSEVVFLRPGLYTFRLQGIISGWGDGNVVTIDHALVRAQTILPTAHRGLIVQGEKILDPVVDLIYDPPNNETGYRYYIIGNTVTFNGVTGIVEPEIPEFISSGIDNGANTRYLARNFKHIQTKRTKQTSLYWPFDATHITQTSRFLAITCIEPPPALQTSSEKIKKSSLTRPKTPKIPKTLNLNAPGYRYPVYLVDKDSFEFTEATELPFNTVIDLFTTSVKGTESIFVINSNMIYRMDILTENENGVISDPQDTITVSQAATPKTWVVAAPFEINNDGDNCVVAGCSSHGIVDFYDWNTGTFGPWNTLAVFGPPISMFSYGKYLYILLGPGTITDRSTIAKIVWDSRTNQFALDGFIFLDNTGPQSITSAQNKLSFAPPITVALHDGQHFWILKPLNGGGGNLYKYSLNGNLHEIIPLRDDHDFSIARIRFDGRNIIVTARNAAARGRLESAYVIDPETNSEVIPLILDSEPDQIIDLVSDSYAMWALRVISFEVFISEYELRSPSLRARSLFLERKLDISSGGSIVTVAEMPICATVVDMITSQVDYPMNTGMYVCRASYFNPLLQRDPYLSPAWFLNVIISARDMPALNKLKDDKLKDAIGYVYVDLYDITNNVEIFNSQIKTNAGIPTELEVSLNFLPYYVYSYLNDGAMIALRVWVDPDTIGTIYRGSLILRWAGPA